MDFKAVSGCVRTTSEIVAASEGGDPNAIAAIERFEDRLACGLSVIINIFDLDAIVVGGEFSTSIAYTDQCQANCPHTYSEEKPRRQF